MANEFWVTQIDIQGGISFEHIAQFTQLWKLLQNVHLEENNNDVIS
jgi:hypothetical protein